MTMVMETFSAAETRALGHRIGENASPGEIYTLFGDLGAGKTVLTQGVAAGLGIRETVNSPTFTILQIYEEGRLPFYHFDVYRIADVEEMEEIGYEDYFYGDGICFIEWAGLIEELLPEHCKRITITKDLHRGPDYRRITIEDRQTQQTADGTVCQRAGKRRGNGEGNEDSGAGHLGPCGIRGGCRG